MKFKYTSIAAAALLAVLSHTAFADDAATPAATPAAAAPKPDNEFTYNLGATSDYRYRGISQSNLKPALQGGADYTNNPTGFYAGTWLSTIKWITDVGGSGNIEWDLYAGKRGDIATDFSYDVGVLSYVYPGNKLSQVGGVNADTTEIYGQLTYKLANVKYSQSVTNLFGISNSKNSSYVDVWTSIPLTDALNLGLHGGYQMVKNDAALSYADWKVGLSQDFFAISWTLGVVGTNATKSMYMTPDGKFTGKTSLVLSASKTF